MAPAWRHPQHEEPPGCPAVGAPSWNLGCAGGHTSQKLGSTLQEQPSSFPAHSQAVQGAGCGKMEMEKSRMSLIPPGVSGAGSEQGDGNPCTSTPLFTDTWHGPRKKCSCSMIPKKVRNCSQPGIMHSLGRQSPSIKAGVLSRRLLSLGSSSASRTAPCAKPSRE